ITRALHKRATEETHHGSDGGDIGSHKNIASLFASHLSNDGSDLVYVRGVSFCFPLAVTVCDLGCARKISWRYREKTLCFRGLKRCAPAMLEPWLSIASSGDYYYRTNSGLSE